MVQGSDINLRMFIETYFYDFKQLIQGNEHMLSYQIQDERENHLIDDPTNTNSETLERHLFESSKESGDIRIDDNISEFSDESLSSVSVLTDSDLKVDCNVFTSRFLMIEFGPQNRVSKLFLKNLFRF